MNRPADRATSAFLNSRPAARPTHAARPASVDRRRKPARSSPGPASAPHPPASRRRTQRCADASGIDHEADRRVLLPASCPLVGRHKPTRRGCRRDQPRGKRESSTAPPSRAAEPHAARAPAGSTARPTNLSCSPRRFPRCRAANPARRGIRRNRYRGQQAHHILPRRVAEPTRYAGAGGIDCEADERVLLLPCQPPPGDHPGPSTIPNCSGIKKWVKDG